MVETFQTHNKVSLFLYCSHYTTEQYNRFSDTLPRFTNLYHSHYTTEWSTNLHTHYHVLLFLYCSHYTTEQYNRFSDTLPRLTVSLLYSTTVFWHTLTSHCFYIAVTTQLNNTTDSQTHYHVSLFPYYIVYQSFDTYSRLTNSHHMTNNTKTQKYMQKITLPTILPFSTGPNNRNNTIADPLKEAFTTRIHH